MMYSRQTAGEVQDVVDKLQQAASENQFGVLGIHNLKEKMEAKGVEFGTECQVLEVCNPKQAKKVLEQNMSISTALPCRISVWREGDKVTVATIRPTILLCSNRQSLRKSRRRLNRPSFVLSIRLVAETKERVKHNRLKS